MEVLRKVLVSACLVLGLAGCTCTLAACGSDVAEEEQQSRFVVDGCGYEYMFVTTVTDTETGQEWVVVATYQGVAIAPIEERE